MPKKYTEIQCNVIGEKKQVAARIANSERLVKSRPNTKVMPSEDLELLKEQIVVMKAYDEILGRRIDKF